MYKKEKELTGSFNVRIIFYLYFRVEGMMVIAEITALWLVEIGWKCKQSRQWRCQSPQEQSMSYGHSQQASRKHADIILTPLNPTFIR